MATKQRAKAARSHSENVKLSFDSIEEPRNPPRKFVTPAGILDACTSAPAVPDLADALEWRRSALTNGQNLLDGLMPAFARVMRPARQGFGFRTGSAVLATWHLRAFVDRGGPPSEWGQIAITALDVVANAVSLWKLWRCQCGRQLAAHMIVAHDNLLTGEQMMNRKGRQGFRFREPIVYSLDCGRFIRASEWFEATLALPYPNKPAQFKAVRPVVRMVVREWLWHCLWIRYHGDEQTVVPKCVRDQLFKALPRDSPGGHAGEVIREGASKAIKTLEPYCKAGVAGIGLGLMKHKGALVFAVA